MAYTLDPGDITYPGPANAQGWAPIRSGPGVTDTIGWVLKELVEPGNPPPLLLMSWEWQSGSRYESAYIVGEVKNLTGRTLDYVQITCTLFDTSDRQVGSTLDNTNNLSAGSVWRFKALVTEESARKYRCSTPEGY